MARWSQTNEVASLRSQDSSLDAETQVLLELNDLAVASRASLLILMANIRRFEDLSAWKLARVLTNRIYDFTIVGDFSRDFGLRDQMRKAAVSIVSNIAEGFERDGDKEFAQFLFVAKGSCGELRAQLYIAHDRRYITDEEFTEVFSSSLEVSRMISGLIRYLRQSQISGKKYKSTT